MRRPIKEMGRYYDDQRLIVVRVGLLLVDERRVLWHELTHAARRDKICDLTSKAHRAVDRDAVRLAMPWPALREAMRGDYHESERADMLKTTVKMLRLRLETAHPSEKGRLRLLASMRESTA